MSTTRISGYLSIHKTGTDEDSGLQLKWAPNRAMSVPQEYEEQQQKRLLHKQTRLNSHRFSDAIEETNKILLNES